MSVIWLGLLSISVSWFFFVPMFNATNWKTGCLFLISGAVLIFYSFYNQKIQKCSIKEPHYWPRCLCTGFLVTVTILYFQATLLPFYFIVASRYHKMNMVSPVICFLANITGLETSISQGTIFVQNNEHLVALTTTYEKLGIYLFMNILLGGVLILLIIPVSKKIKKFMILFSVSVGYLIVRYLLLMFIFTDFSNPKEITFPSKANLFWNPICVFLSFLPLALLMVKLCPLEEQTWPQFSLNQLKINNNRSTGFAIISLLLFALFTVGFHHYQDSGSMKKGRILFDEYHSGMWEQTSRKLDKDWYGSMSMYNYYCLIDWLRHYYSVDVNYDKLYTPEYLNSFDILVLKTPIKKFASEEVKTIVQFVESGGGLFLMGDHTNLLGMGTFLNQIAEQFKLRFNYDSCNSLSTGHFSSYVPSKFFSHSVVQNIPPFDFLTSCSLYAPIWAENVMIGYNLMSDRMDYSQRSFFGNGMLDADEDYGLFLQTTAIKHGKGRVVCFSDSTVFSNFSMFQGGHPEFMLRTLDYLNRINKQGYSANIMFLIIAGISFAISVWYLKKLEKFLIMFLILIVTLPTFFISTILFGKINNMNYPALQPHSKFIRICFVREHSNFYLPPALGHSHFITSLSFSTFYVSTQRLGFIPSVESSLNKSLIGGDAIVIINPSKHFTNNQKKAMVEYVNHGGRILLLDGKANQRSSSNEILSSFGMHIDYAQSPPVTGGKLSFSIPEKNVFVYTADVGKGVVATVRDSRVFSDEIMGHVMEVPDESKKELYESEFHIFEEVLFGTRYEQEFHK